jgi:hypothetical protein
MLSKAYVPTLPSARTITIFDMRISQPSGMQGELDMILDWGEAHADKGCSARAEEHGNDPVC